MEKIEIINEDKDIRLDIFLAERYPQYSRSGIKQYITKGNIKVNNKQVKAGYSLRVGDIVLVDIPQPQPVNLVAQNIPLDIVYSDSDLAVINKQQGLTVHLGAGHQDGTLVNALLYHFKDLSGINGELRPGIVHRLDKDTSGLMLVAKNDFSHRDLAKQIAEKTCIRRYIALVEGKWERDEGVIQTYIARSKTDRKKMAVSTDPDDRIAITNYKVIKRYSDYTLLNFILKTGRTHQIRVHCAHLNCPIVGDQVYGYKKQKFKLDGQLLHSEYIEFTHPRTKKRLSFNAQLPDYFKKVITILDNK